MTTVEIDKSSYLYDVLEEWLANHPSSKKSTRFRAEVLDPDDDDMDSDAPMAILMEADNKTREDTASVVIMQPSQRLRCFMHSGHWIQVKYASDTVKSASGRKAEETRERIELSTFGRNRSIAKSILQEAVNLFELGNKDAQRIYVSQSRDWNKIGRKRMRPAESVVLDGQMMEELIADAKEFERDFNDYQKLGIPHRRGYLLEGPPGTGKSSLIQVVSGKLERDIYYLKLAADDMSDDTLEELVMEVPHDAVLVIEDVDAAFHGRVNQQNARGQKMGLTFSGLLNILDGIAATEGRLLFMTTNHIERLDPALIRPGRVDRIVSFGYATITQIERRFEAFFPLEPFANAKALAELVAPQNVTMAEVQQYLLLFRKNGEQAFANRHRFKQLTTNSAELVSDKFSTANVTQSGEIVPAESSYELRNRRDSLDELYSRNCNEAEWANKTSYGSGQTAKCSAPRSPRRRKG